VLEFPATRAPTTLFSRPITPHRSVAFGSLSLSEVKAIKNTHHVTVNDVVVCVCTGAIRRCLERRESVPEEPLVAMIPLSVRTDEQRETYGNRIAFMYVSIPTDESDPLLRLRRIRASMVAVKERFRAVPASVLQDVNHFVPPALFARAARGTLALSRMGTLRPPANVVISNVPGAPVPLFQAGAKIISQHPLAQIFDGVGLNISVFSYEDHLDFGVVTDREMLRDADELMEDLRHSLQELAAVGVSATSDR
jgi:WS/DGAT/MGAT family acyltransferase